MKKNLLKFGFILFLLTLLTGCPRPVDGAQDPQDGPNTNETLPNDSLTKKIAAATTSLDFENKEIAEDAEVSKAITIKNLKLGGKTLTVKASGTELQNVSNATIIIDQQVGDGVVTLTGCSNITKLEVNGGGSNSIHIKDSKVASVEVKKEAVRVAMEGTSQVDAVVVNAANTKIESEKTITIKAITVNEAIDKVTVKGGTVQKIEVVAFDEEGTPTDAPSESQGESQTSAQIIIDGKTEVQSVVGTTEVTLTDDAVENCATVIIAPDEEVTPPTASFEGTTLTFETDGSVEGTIFEGKKYYYEYVYNIQTDNIEMQVYKVKLYKLEDSIEFYLYTSQTHPNFPNIHSQKFLESDTNSLNIQDLYDTTLVLSSAGLVQGEFSTSRPDCTSVSYNKTFDITSCGMPVTLVMPEDPSKPVVTITATSQGNNIHISNSTCFYNSIEIYAAEKDENNKWKPSKTKLFTFDGYNYENPPAYTSLDFLDSYVNARKEYAYYVDTSKYRETDKYEYSDTNLYHAVTAAGGNGEIVMQAEATNQGIKIIVPEIPTSDKYALFDTLKRGEYQSNYTSINNLNKLKGEPVIDYFVNAQ